MEPLGEGWEQVETEECPLQDEGGLARGILDILSRLDERSFETWEDVQLYDYIDLECVEHLFTTSQSSTSPDSQSSGYVVFWYLDYAIVIWNHGVIEAYVECEESPAGTTESPSTKGEETVDSSEVG